MQASEDPRLSVERRVIDATLQALARWGTTKTTMSDVARLAGCSRATIYRAFPGGKDQLLAEVARRELCRFFVEVGSTVSSAENIEDALTAAVVESVRWVRGHQALQYLVEHETPTLLPFLGFGQVDRLHRAAAVLGGPYLTAFVPLDQAQWLAEWTGRLVVSLLFNPPEADPADPAAARLLVQRFLLPAVATGASPTRADSTHVRSF